MFIVLDCFECCLYCDFGFVVVDIVVDYLVYWDWFFYVCFDFFDGGELVYGFGEVECVF